MGRHAQKMRLALAPGLAINESSIEGMGCFSSVQFKRGRKIAEYSGEKISDAEANRRANRRKLRICAINNRWSLDGSRGGNGTHYINHSCEPNAYMKILYGHILFIALRDIKPGEEITIDYQSTLHSDRKRCGCGAPSCRGTINKV
jgi:SET domain-containing protein